MQTQIKQNSGVFNQNGAIFSLNGMPLKLGDQFTFHSSNISSTENNVNIGKAWTAIDRLMAICKSDLSEKKRGFFHVSTIVWLYHMDFNKILG